MTPTCAPVAQAIEPEFRILPAAAVQTPAQRAYARSAECALFVRIVTRREIPPAILDGGLVDSIVHYVRLFGVVDGARQFKRDAMKSRRGRRALAICRAIPRNVARLKSQGVDLWAQ